MERLTIRNSDGSVSQLMGLDWGEALERLAAYEDSKLTPEQVMDMAENAETRLLTYFEAVYGVPVGRMMELAEAAAERRAFVQPCEMGKPVFMVVTKVSGKTGKPFSFVKKSRLTESNFFRVASGWGETAFPYWQEAEEARKKMVQNGDVVDGV